MQRVRILSGLLLPIIVLLLVTGCTVKPGIGVDINADNKSSDSRVLFSQPF